MIGRRKLVSSVSLLALAGCGSSAQIKADLVAVGKATGVLTAQGEVNLYGIAKGLALVAEAAVPSLGPAIQEAISLADPLQQLAEQGQATVDQIAQLSEQTKKLTLTAAPYIKAVSNGLKTA